MAGSSGYDVVFPSASPFLARQVAARHLPRTGFLETANRAKLEPSALTNLAKSDPGNKHAIPYMFAATGIGVNLGKVKELAPDVPLDSWAILLEPKWTGLLKALRLTLLDDPTEVLAAAYAYRGVDPSTEKTADLDAAIDFLSNIRGDPEVHPTRRPTSTTLANGDICVAHGYGGDLIQARDRARRGAKGVEVLVFLPKEAPRR